MLGTIRHETGDRAGAVGAWQRVRALDPADVDTLFNLAIVLRDTGRTADAREAAVQFLARAPRSSAPASSNSRHDRPLTRTGTTQFRIQNAEFRNPF
ncbi:MAG: tetratricopeptide repeat protein [Vicinamibacterales bacterium]